MKKTTFNFTRRILALLLVCCLCMIPFPFATAEEEVPATDPEVNEPTEATVVEEVSDSRGEIEKHYLCSDGNYIGRNQYFK